MSNTIKTILAYLFVTISGVLLHFAYDWSGQNPIVGTFSAVSESTWEHLKLIFYPFLLLTLWQSLIKYRDDSRFLPSRVLGILAAMVFTITAFYTYSGVLGENVDFVNITIFFLAVALGFWVEKKVYEASGRWRRFSPQIAVSILLVFCFLFFVFTFLPPDIGLFAEPDAENMKTFFLK